MLTCKEKHQLQVLVQDYMGRGIGKRPDTTRRYEGDFGWEMDIVLTVDFMRHEQILQQCYPYYIIVE